MDSVLVEIERGEVTEQSRQRYALKAFEHTADYDETISDFFREQYMSGSQQISLRYGTNPHQKPALAYMKGDKLPFKELCGSPGFINLLDAVRSGEKLLRIWLLIWQSSTRGLWSRNSKQH